MPVSTAASVRNWPRMRAFLFFLRAQGLFQADLPGPFCDGHQHDVHDADAAYQQGDAGDPDQLAVGRGAEILQSGGLLQQVFALILNGFVGPRTESC